jgi:glycosyltransferase involved in cell wall biosynthesis
MKILYIYDKMPGVYQKYLLNLLLEIQKKYAIKTLVYEKNRLADFSVVRYGLKDYLNYFLYKVKLSKYKSIDAKYMNNFDIIHLQHSFLWRKLEIFRDKNTIPKIIITLRGGDTFVKPWLSNSWKNFYKNSDHISAFVVMSDFQKKYLQKWGVNENKIHVIPISFGTFSNATPKYPNKKILKLASAFRLTWEKNIEGTIFFAKCMKDRGVSFVYDIYGDGNDLGQLLYFIDYYQLNDCVFVKGKVDNELLKVKLLEYDFFVQLSYSEAFPTSVLEAQSIGIPCVVSNSGGLPEAVVKNKTALVDNYKNIENLVSETIQLYNDSERYFDFSKNAIDFVNQNFAINNEIVRLSNLYKLIH